MKFDHKEGVVKFEITIDIPKKGIHQIHTVEKLFDRSQFYYNSEEADDPSMIFWFYGKPTKQHTLLALQVDGYELLDVVYQKDVRTNLFDKFFEE